MYINLSDVVKAPPAVEVHWDLRNIQELEERKVVQEFHGQWWQREAVSTAQPQSDLNVL
jgi:hypothetical protein